MAEIAYQIGSHTGLFCVLAVMNQMMIALICVLIVPVIFRVELRKNALLWIGAAVLSAAVGAARPFCQGAHLNTERLWELASLLQPFLCALMLIPFRHVWKGFAAALGYTFVEAPKYLILVLFFHYDNANPNYSQDFFVELLLDLAAFLPALYLFANREEKRRFFAPVLLIDPVFYVLIVLTVAVFIVSLALFGFPLSAENRPSAAFSLMNIPLFAATIAYGVSNTVRARAAQEHYREELDRQIRHYEAMEKMNEDLRIFRHDLPKKLGPMVAYLEENDAASAMEIARELGASAGGASRRYRTGNYRLDTVLFCEQQTASADGIRIVFTPDSVFPAEGIGADAIYTIFPNALDNAIEACRLAEGEREITVASRIVGDEVFVTVSNPFRGEVRMKNGLPRTTKKDKRNHGYGMRSIKKAAADYGSDNVDFRTENGMFLLRISLRFRDRLSEQRQQPAQ